MAEDYDLIIRGGMIVDGAGGEPFVGDLAIAGGRIAAVGTVDGTAAEIVDADGLIVTPGFVDVHTHYDGQAIWSSRLNPSSAHGVTTAIMGNCGVGFAPCRPQDHDTLVRAMEGVEDIPGVVMAEGIDWSWETFPEFLDVLESRPHDIDFAAYLPHSPLRVYVMGERGVRLESATDDDLARMRALAREAVAAGAMGFASSRMMYHRTADNEHLPSWNTATDEIVAIAEGMAEAGGGLIQCAPEIPKDGYRASLAPLVAVSERTGQPLTFTLTEGFDGEVSLAREALELSEEANGRGVTVTGQVFPRPVGLIFSLETSAHAFCRCPSYMAIADRPFDERLALMRDPEMRSRLLAEAPVEGHMLVMMARNWDWIFPLGDEPDYEPRAADSIAARAKARGVSPEEESYDRLIEGDGRAMMLGTLGNFPGHSLDRVLGLMRHPNTVIGLGDGGAHYGLICDGSYPTYVLTHWVRDRTGARMALEEAVKAITSDPARLVGLADRGLLRPGYKADINIIDFAGLRLHKPQIVQDLPAQGKRLDQSADGFVATFVSGRCIAQNGVPTGALPGRLVRGRQQLA